MTPNLLLTDAWEPGRPPCWNRKPYRPGAWMRNGHRGLKPVLRWVPRWFEDRCAVGDGIGIGPNGENYIEANGYQCGGCRWRAS